MYISTDKEHLKSTTHFVLSNGSQCLVLVIILHLLDLSHNCFLCLFTNKSAQPSLKLVGTVSSRERNIKSRVQISKTLSFNFLLMAYYRRSMTSSILDGFSLNPLPYPVILILAVISIFLGVSWYFSYESVVETAEEQMGWILFATPVVLIFVVKWLSSLENSDWLFGISPWERRRRTHRRPSEGASPWGVAALIVLVLILVQYQSIFLDSWFV